jgi:SulP family sulfate permease
MPEHYVGKVMVLIRDLPSGSLPVFIVGAVTLAILLLWPRLKTPVPAHLPAVIIGSVVAYVGNQHGWDVATIGSTFHFTLPDGSQGSGIPALLPDFQWPWNRTQPGEAHLVFSWQMAQDMLSSAFAIAMLGAIESLLCAVVLDGMSGKKHSANSELLGQGIGNIIAPFFGGITATAAIARSAANLKSGAQTPVAAMIHAVIVLISLVSLSSLLGYMPMTSMAALLFIVAWNMSEAPKALQLVKKAPRSDVLVFVVCFSLTVVFDMVVAITAGIVLASLLFMKEIAEMTRINDITDNKKLVSVNLPADWKVFKINGPLFFAAADRVFGELAQLSAEQKVVILQLDGVSILDSGGVSALNKFIDSCKKLNIRIYLTDFQYQPLRTLSKAGFKPDGVISQTFSTLTVALNELPDSSVAATQPA